MPRPSARHAAPESLAAASAAAAEAFAGGLAALDGGDPARAALRFGLALRLEPGFAADVLEAVGVRTSDAGLVLVRGDALRLLGREDDALAAFDRAMGRLAAEDAGLRWEAPTIWPDQHT